jgi:type IV pilus assembly protein PilE
MASLRNGGFTLVELMVALAVVGILTVIVLPTYQSSVNKSRRAECRAGLVVALQNEERYFTTNNGYDALATIGSPTWTGNSSTSAAGSACTLVAYAGTTSGVAGATALAGRSNSVVVVATPQGWSDSQCRASAYAMDSTGSFTPLDASSAPTTSPSGCF